MNIVIATIKSWNVKKAEEFKRENSQYSVTILTKKEEFNYEHLKELNPEYIFIPHWSWIIPRDIYSNFNCVVFHMTDLPYGRGGSPLQNLIARGYEETKISAIQVEKGIDTGDIYLKENLSLHGTADEIFIRASKIIFDKMIPFIIKNKITPFKQTGDIIEFKRRKREQSQIDSKFSLEQIYNHIRMLDGEGYPNAFIRFGNYKLKFSRASLKSDKIIADVEIVEED